MEIFKNVIALVQVIAWPVVALIIAIMFKEQIRDLITKIKSAKLKDFSIELSEAREAAEASIRSNLKSQSSPSTPQLMQEIKQLVDISPKLLVLESWAKIEQAIMNQLVKRDIKKEDFRKYLDSRTLANSYIINYDDMKIYDNLMSVRNKVIHNRVSEIDKDQAAEYANIAAKFINILNIENDEIS
jgi:hypothetical protein